MVVVPALRRTDFERALAAAPLPHRTVVGGAERQQSVLAGLEAVAAGTRIVLVHDAARPFVPAPVVQRVIDAVRAGADAVIPVLPVVDTVRQVTGETSVVLERTSLRAVQTPQGFNLDVLLASHHAALAAGLAATDDARVCEFAGHPVTLVEGHREAFKVTEPIDLALAEALAASRTGVSR
ncbi:2-C-methyl-D-erythritol 4-phosphate cytidylyltransferase [Microlunatus panaciterrae]|uniref:2-C-methyl-D-erythritol 4-phosphate cytidylyltransferase n=1 Tax=Microlunatus panaciterrae TaxID=400768 RepID=A0ABS2RH65_9ACTN|nr:2-C-methyl-D-erythritol 4-phosphate cytidylyltransferase [Microlunatus panaciterrae]